MSERKAHLDSVAVASLVLCSFLWGLNQIAAKAVMGEVPPLVQATLRSIAGALLVALWARWRGIPLFQRDGTLLGGLLAGALFAAEFACIFVGLQYTTVSRLVVFLYASPFVVALVMPFLSRAERLNRVQVAGLVLAFAGVAGAFSEGFTQPATGPQQWIGDVLGVAAAVFWAGTTFCIRATPLAHAAPEKTLVYQLAVSGVLLLLGSCLHGDPWPRSYSTLAIGSLLFQTVVVACASYLLWFWLIRHYPATRLSAFTLLTPVFGLLMGAVLLDEPLTPRLLLALACVSIGMVLVNRRGRRNETLSDGSA